MDYLLLRLGVLDLVLNVLLGRFLYCDPLSLLLGLHLLDLLLLLLMGGRLMDQLRSKLDVLLQGVTLRLDMFVDDLMLLGLLVLLLGWSVDNLMARLMLQNDLRRLLMG